MLCFLVSNNFPLIQSSPKEVLSTTPISACSLFSVLQEYVENSKHTEKKEVHVCSRIGTPKLADATCPLSSD